MQIHAAHILTVPEIGTVLIKVKNLNYDGIQHQWKKGTDPNRAPCADCCGAQPVAQLRSAENSVWQHGAPSSCPPYTLTVKPASILSSILFSPNVKVDSSRPNQNLPNMVNSPLINHNFLQGHIVKALAVHARRTFAAQVDRERGKERRIETSY